jgi:hypothetical protein
VYHEREESWQGEQRVRKDAPKEGQCIRVSIKVRVRRGRGQGRRDARSRAEVAPTKPRVAWPSSRKDGWTDKVVSFADASYKNTVNCSVRPITLPLSSKKHRRNCLQVHGRHRGRLRFELLHPFLIYPSGCCSKLAAVGLRFATQYRERRHTRERPAANRKGRRSRRMCFVSWPVCSYSFILRLY